MLLLQNAIQPYAWGSLDGMAGLVGSAPTGGPEAELWVGTHPAAPSLVVSDPEGRTLDAVIASDPERWLGRELADAGYEALPFLLKVLAVGEPLSLQAHPSTAQARAGYDREERAGIALDAPNRTYRDRSAKPEALVSLTDTWALCGFRSTGESVVLVEKLAVGGLEPLVRRLTASDDRAMEESFTWLLHVDGDHRHELAREIGAAAAGFASEDPGDPFGWVARLATLHPGDPTAIAPLLLNLVHLAPGDAVHLPAGNLHAYLTGAGVEVMAASDNVLRGGLTPKNVDVDELIAIVEFDAGLPHPPARREVAPGVTAFDCSDDTFGLALVDSDEPVTIEPTQPSLLLAVGGDVDVAGADGGCSIDGGAALFVPPGEGELVVSGPGQLWWATVGAGLPG